MLSKNTQKLKFYNASIAYTQLERKRIRAELKKLRANNDKTLVQLKEYLDKVKCCHKTSKN